MAIGPIPFTAIAEYIRMYGIEEPEEFAYIIRQMDNTYLELEAEKSTAGNQKGGEKSASTNSDQKNPNQGGHKRR